MYPYSPLTTLFHDVPLAEAEEYAKSLSWQPAEYRESIHVSYCAWKDTPSVYLCCSEDRILPLESQRKMADLAGAEVESCDAGHMVVLSQPERVVEVVLGAAGEPGGVGRLERIDEVSVS